jgi:hypothetical protein
LLPPGVVGLLPLLLSPPLAPPVPVPPVPVLPAPPVPVPVPLLLLFPPLSAPVPVPVPLLPAPEFPGVEGLAPPGLVGLGLPGVVLPLLLPVPPIPVPFPPLSPGWLVVLPPLFDWALVSPADVKKLSPLIASVIAKSLVGRFIIAPERFHFTDAHSPTANAVEDYYCNRSAGAGEVTNIRKRALTKTAERLFAGGPWKSCLEDQ